MADVERLAYGAYSPDVFDPDTGKLKSEAIRTDHLLGTKGVHVDARGDSSGTSVCRIDVDGALQELEGTLEKIAAVPGRGRHIVGAGVTEASAVRAITNAEGQKVFQVLDDGCEGYRSHAVIRASDGFTRGAIKGPRDDLLKLFNARILPMNQLVSEGN